MYETIIIIRIIIIKILLIIIIIKYLRVIDIELRLLIFSKTLKASISLIPGKSLSYIKMKK